MITAPVASGGGVYGGAAPALAAPLPSPRRRLTASPSPKWQFFAQDASIGTSTAVPYMVQWDTTKVANGSVALTATAADIDGNVGTSVTDTVTVSN
jgi:hypothetical protein